MAGKSKPSRPLDEYKSKRQFDRTPEPAGGAAADNAAATKRPIFCVQMHLATNLHYDFRLEHAGVLLSWAVPKGPSLNPADKRLAMMTEDHPLDYADFEGVIPEGYGQGIVMLWDKGTWQGESGHDDIDAALRKGELKFRLDGVKLKGSWVLVRTRPRGAAAGESAEQSRQWLLIKHRDEWSGELDITEFAPLSVASGGDLVDVISQSAPHVWQSHRDAGPAEKELARLRKIVAKAVKLRDDRQQRDGE